MPDIARPVADLRPMRRPIAAISASLAAPRFAPPWPRRDSRLPGRAAIRASLAAPPTFTRRPAFSRVVQPPELTQADVQFLQLQQLLLPQPSHSMPSPGQGTSRLHAGLHCLSSNTQTSPGSQGSSSSQSTACAGRHAPTQSSHSGHDPVAHWLHTLPGPQLSQLPASHDGAQLPVAKMQTLPGPQSSWASQPPAGGEEVVPAPPPPSLSGTTTSAEQPMTELARRTTANFMMIII
jgi:hypothetical protein